MNRVLLVVGILLCLLTLSTDSDAKKMDKIIIFPFKMVTKGQKAQDFSNELVGALAAELTRDGDVEVISGMPFISVMQQQKIDPKRLLKIAEKVGAQGVLWGTVSQLEDGLSLETYVATVEPGSKPKFFQLQVKILKIFSTR